MARALSSAAPLLTTCQQAPVTKLGVGARVGHLPPLLPALHTVLPPCTPRSQWCLISLPHLAPSLPLPVRGGAACPRHGCQSARRRAKGSGRHERQRAARGAAGAPVRHAGAAVGMCMTLPRLGSQPAAEVATAGSAASPRHTPGRSGPALAPCVTPASLPFYRSAGVQRGGHDARGVCAGCSGCPHLGRPQRRPRVCRPGMSRGERSAAQALWRGPTRANT